jgi:membrane protein DedA with SNARE-associated domain
MVRTYIRPDCQLRPVRSVTIALMESKGQFVAAATIVAGAHHHHYHHYASVDLVGLFAAAFASWVGVPGPGEPLLVAAGILAAKHHLAISGVLLVAWAGAATGGMTGWVVGLKAGRGLLARPGPLHKLRLRALERGEQVFDRAPVPAILLTPSWVAGIHRVGIVVYTLVNAASAAAWAVGIGLGAYYAGPPILDLASDAGTVTLFGLIGLIAIVLVGEGYRRFRRSRRVGDGPTAG